jgi:alkylhydroperoxidase family enzyme
VALAWTRDYSLFNGDFPDPEVVSAFQAEYSEQQQRDILAVLTIMGFANRVTNSVSGKVLMLE